MFLRCLLCFCLLASSLLAQGPIPFLQEPLVPSAMAPAGPTFILAVNGSNFVPGAVVFWNEERLITTFVSNVQVMAEVPARRIGSAGTARILVSNPGGLRSNETYFYVTSPASSVAYTDIFTASTFSGQRVTVDFNFDGKLDQALVDPYSRTLVTLLGNGDGTFQDAISHSSAFPVDGLNTADFNGDGKPDFATFTFFPSIGGYILLGNGNGTFRERSHFSTARNPEELEVGDVNKDGALDLVVLAYGGLNGKSKISVLLGNGDGTFMPKGEDLPAGYAAHDIALGDFNGDGNLDVALAGGFAPNLAIYLGNGDGTFQQRQLYSVGADTTVLIAADFNGDDRADLAAAYQSDSVLVSLNNGDGTFQPAITVPAGTDIVNLTAADLNADGKVDLACGDWLFSGANGAVVILLGNGDGTFASPISEGLEGIQPGLVLAGDYNRDGKPDLTVSYEASGKITTLLGQ